MLSPGTKVGALEVVGALGAGGMGEVYRARDTRLGRDVALKVIPDLFADDPERLARFTREAQTLAALNHPNIAHIHGIEESGPIRALVMELVEGEDLRERLHRGAMPIAEALSVARQIAEALEAAHERGIVHRDLKPANIKVTDDGRVKVLDFGLAKVFAPTSGSQGLRHQDAGTATAPDASAANSPTFSMRATAMGTILGTAAYMAPEQAKGKVVDRRADVWAFGVVLYEMLTGRRAFDATETSEVLVSVLRDTPPFEALPVATPESIRRLLRRCFEKDRARRLDSMAAARLEIDEALALPSSTTTSFSAPAPAAVPPMRRRAAAWAIAALALALLVGVAALVRPWQATRAPAPFRLSAQLGFDGHAADNLSRAIALAPDGQAIAFAGRLENEERTKLFYRRLDELQATAIPGTEDAAEPFFSPNGQWIGFVSTNKLLKASVSGGAVVSLAEVLNARGATWGDDDVISYTPVATAGGQVMRIPAAGGTPVPLGPMIERHVTQRWPHALPGNVGLLYTGLDHVDNFEQACLVVHPLPDGPSRIVMCGGYGWRYANTGHVLYVHRGTLFAIPFDLKTLNTSGSPVAVIQGIRGNPASGVANFAVSDGLLAYLPGREDASAVALEEVDRAGQVQKLPLPPQDWQTLTYSPDGRQLALVIAAGTNTDIWIYNSVREALTRLTFSDVPEAGPVWTPDGRHVTYASAQSGPPNLFWKRADGAAEEQRLSRSPLVQFPTSWHPDGRHLLFLQQSQTTGLDVMVIAIEEDQVTGDTAAESAPVVATAANEAFGTFSPDGKWVAYASDESGRAEVYVRAFRGGGGRWQVSTDGGSWPAWSRTSPELLFGTSSGAVMAVKYDVSGETFSHGRPQPWTRQPMLVRSVGPMYALHPDGKRIAGSILANQPDTRPRNVILVTGFDDELRRLSLRQAADR